MDLQQRTFTVEDVYRMVEAGVLDADDHVELLDGVLCQMSPQGPAHRSLTIRIHRRLEQAYGDVGHIQDHSNLRLDDLNLPEPDVAVVRGSEDDYFHHLPTGDDVILLVEIAVTSQRRDRVKAALYARTGIAEFWLLDVPGRTLTVHRDPAPTGYARAELLQDTSDVALPGTHLRWSIAELLPPAG